MNKLRIILAGTLFSCQPQIAIGHTCQDPLTEEINDTDLLETGWPDTDARFWFQETLKSGKEIFSRQEVSCINCHSGPSGTNNMIIPMMSGTNNTTIPTMSCYDPDGYQSYINVPNLLDLGKTAPYMHDGSMPSLTKLLACARDGSHGNTLNLDNTELKSLEVFLLNFSKAN